MEFEGDNYEDFFDKLRSRTGPRNLQQIFDDDEKPLQYETNSLRYQPQKSQYQKGGKHKSEAKSKSSHNDELHTATATTNIRGDRWTVIIAKVAHGYNGKDKIGRVGVALTMNESEPTKQIRLIVYKSRSDILSTLLLTSKTKKPNVILKESYIQFYDNEKQFWSVRFESLTDEEEFIRVMMKHDLPLERVPTTTTLSPNNIVITSTYASTSSNDKPSKGNSTSTTVNLEKGSRLPHPQPRPRLLPRPGGQQIESEEEIEDIIVTPIPQAIASKELIPLNMALATTTSSAIEKKEISPNSNVNKLDNYMVEQRATGQVMEKKMDSILQVMSLLTAKGSASGSSTGSGEYSNSLFKDSASIINDKEDELLELEQKILDCKKENRALIKTLKAKEQALNDLRTSTCASCEELLAQNIELKQQNAALLGAITQLRSQHVSVGTGDCSSSTCQKCDQLEAKILILARRLSIMQNANSSSTDDRAS